MLQNPNREIRNQAQFLTEQFAQLDELSGVLQFYAAVREVKPENRCFLPMSDKYSAIFDGFGSAVTDFVGNILRKISGGISALCNTVLAALSRGASILSNITITSTQAPVNLLNWLSSATSYVSLTAFSVSASLFAMYKKSAITNVVELLSTVAAPRNDVAGRTTAILAVTQVAQANRLTEKELQSAVERAVSEMSNKRKQELRDTLNRMIQNDNSPEHVAILRLIEEIVKEQQVVQGKCSEWVMMFKSETLNLINLLLKTLFGKFVLTSITSFTSTVGVMSMALGKMLRIFIGFIEIADLGIENLFGIKVFGLRPVLTQSEELIQQSSKKMSAIFSKLVNESSDSSSLNNPKFAV